MVVMLLTISSQCLHRTLACMSDGDWFCPSCKPERRGGGRSMNSTWSLRSARGCGRVILSSFGARPGCWPSSCRAGPPRQPPPTWTRRRTATTPAAPGTATPRRTAPACRTRGFPKSMTSGSSYVGDERLRPLSEGIPSRDGFEQEYYVMEEVVGMRKKGTRMEYLVAWEGYDIPTWKPCQFNAHDVAESPTNSEFVVWLVAGLVGSGRIGSAGRPPRRGAPAAWTRGTALGPPGETERRQVQEGVPDDGAGARGAAADGAATGDEAGAGGARARGVS